MTMETQQTRPVAIQRKWFNSDDAVEVFSIEFDAVVSEDVVLSSVVTRQPVDTGVSISDHMYDEPDRLTVQALVSDALPWAALENQQRGLAVSDPFSEGSTSRAAKALAVLDSLRKKHEPFSVQTGLRLFTNMVVEKIHYTTDRTNGFILGFTAELSQVKITSTQTVTYYAPKDKKTKRQVAAPKDKGDQQTEEPPEPKVEDMKSILFKLLGQTGL